MLVSFSSLFYLASAKICSHTYHQLLAGVAAAAAAGGTKTGEAPAIIIIHIFCGVFMHFGSVGSLWLLSSLCALRPGNRIALSHFQKHETLASFATLLNE